MNNNKMKGYSLALLGSVGSSFFTIFFLFSGELASPMFVVFMIFLWALIFNTLNDIIFPDKHAQSKFPTLISRKEKAKIVLSFACIFVATILGNYFYQLSLKMTDPIIVQAANRFEIIFVVFVGWLIYKERLNARFWLGMGIVISGFVLTKMSDVNITFLSWTGIMLGICSGISFGMFQTITKYLIRYFTPSNINKYRLVINVFLMFFFPGMIGNILALTPEIVFYTGLAALAGPFTSRLSYMNAIKYVEISHSILFTALAPFFTGFLQVFFLGIPIKPFEIFGIAVIMFGIVISIRYERKPKLVKTAVSK